VFRFGNRTTNRRWSSRRHSGGICGGFVSLGLFGAPHLRKDQLLPSKSRHSVSRHWAVSLSWRRSVALWHQRVVGSRLSCAESLQASSLVAFGFFCRGRQRPPPRVDEVAANPFPPHSIRLRGLASGRQYADCRIDNGRVAQIIRGMEKSEWWQSPVVPAVFCGTVVLVLGFAFCGPSNDAPPAAEAAPPLERVVAAPEATQPAEEVATTTTTASPAAPPARATKADATAMLVELHALEKMGREMAGNRYKGDLATATTGDMAGRRRCMDGMREARPRLERIQARTPALPDGVFSIGLSASELGVCLTCVRSADEACARATTALRDAERELARARW
jgi:hypothetical protein